MRNPQKCLMRKGGLQQCLQVLGSSTSVQERLNQINKNFPARFSLSVHQLWPKLYEARRRICSEKRGERDGMV